ncbi:MAG TPA: CDP-glucose 4,6-dehydratase [Rhizomicrobium sp.]|nr:CDP-glucose 4,6-dehydratase [Rhizomicrobium sp.]
MENLGLTEARAFWQGRRVLLTGHTGFKGSWMMLWLSRLGARVTGFALPPDRKPNLYDILSPWPGVVSRIDDLREAAAVRKAVEESDPEIVIHMAAQAFVRRSFREPVETFAANVMGTAHLLDALKGCSSLRAILVVTSDKVYQNSEGGKPFREGDPLGGDDPYSASKAATEILAQSWRKSFLGGANAPALGTARGGNVIGGGDWGEDRLVPDILRAAESGHKVVLRYPDSTRPWQHVLDVIAGYERYARALASDGATPASLNFGPPPDERALPVRAVVEQLQACLGREDGWTLAEGNPLPEKKLLALDPQKARERLGWRIALPAPEALAWVAAWHRARSEGADMRAFSLGQIEAHEALLRRREPLHA